MAILYSANSQVVVTNTTTETSLLPTPLVIPADGIVVGATLRFYVRGAYTTQDTAPGTLRIRWKFTGGLSGGFGDSQTFTPIGSANHVFSITSAFTVLDVGASGTLVGGGEAIFCTTQTDAMIIGLIQGSSATIDTTGANTVDLTAQWGTAFASNKITAGVVIIEVVTGPG